MIKRKKVKNSNKVKVTFVLSGDFADKPVSVVGEFNDWDPLANPLKLRSNKTLSASLTLDTNQRYAFRYLGSGGNWHNDEAADAYEQNGHGPDTFNCIIET